METILGYILIVLGGGMVGLYSDEGYGSGIGLLIAITGTWLVALGVVHQ